jgi:hypothetical protein
MARFYSLGDARLGRPVDDADLFGLDGESRARARARSLRNLGDALWELATAMRTGDFAVRPRDGACERCDLGAACRVARPAGGDDESGEP